MQLRKEGEESEGTNFLLAITHELTVSGSLLRPEVVTENLVEALQADGVRLFFLVIANL